MLIRIAARPICPTSRWFTGRDLCIGFFRLRCLHAVVLVSSTDCYHAEEEVIQDNMHTQSVDNENTNSQSEY